MQAPPAAAAGARTLPRRPPLTLPCLLPCLPQMATAIKPAQKPGVEEAEAAPIHRIRITLTSKNVRGGGQLFAELVDAAPVLRLQAPF